MFQRSLGRGLPADGLDMTAMVEDFRKIYNHSARCSAAREISPMRSAVGGSTVHRSTLCIQTQVYITCIIER